MRSSSSAASFSASSPRVSCASVTTAFWPTAVGGPSSTAVAGSSHPHRPRPRLMGPKARSLRSAPSVTADGWLASSCSARGTPSRLSGRTFGWTAHDSAQGDLIGPESLASLRGGGPSVVASPQRHSRGTPEQRKPTSRLTGQGRHVDHLRCRPGTGNRQTINPPTLPPHPDDSIPIGHTEGGFVLPDCFRNAPCPPDPQNSGSIALRPFTLGAL